MKDRVKDTGWMGMREEKEIREEKKKAAPEGVGEKKNGDEPEWKKRRMAEKAREDR